MKKLRWELESHGYDSTYWSDSGSGCLMHIFGTDNTMDLLDTDLYDPTPDLAVSILCFWVGRVKERGGRASKNGRFFSSVSSVKLLSKRLKSERLQRTFRAPSW
jgi:hypothetical protein